jgi:2-methylisocitrate lyase-like PEP mutase family enzyme
MTGIFNRDARPLAHSLAGFDFAFMSGFCTSAARLGAPDAGLLSYGEMVDQGRYVNEATSHLPIIGDGDTGYVDSL